MVNKNRLLFAGCAALALTAGCQPPAEEDEDICTPGEKQICLCVGGGQGSQSCRETADGWTPCECGGGDADAGSDAGR